MWEATVEVKYGRVASVVRGHGYFQTLSSCNIESFAEYAAMQSFSMV